MVYNKRKGADPMETEKLIVLAKEAMTHAYAPYSHFHVGAALLCADGTVYQGCNVENAAYGECVCAERNAVFRAVYDGHRDFAAIAICGGREGVIDECCAPCGSCRQVLREFCGDDFRIHMVDAAGTIETLTLGDLLPRSFSKKNL